MGIASSKPISSNTNNSPINQKTIDKKQNQKPKRTNKRNLSTDSKSSTCSSPTNNYLTDELGPLVLDLNSMDIDGNSGGYGSNNTYTNNNNNNNNDHSSIHHSGSSNSIGSLENSIRNSLNEKQLQQHHQKHIHLQQHQQIQQLLLQQQQLHLQQKQYNQYNIQDGHLNSSKLDQDDYNNFENESEIESISTSSINNSGVNSNSNNNINNSSNNSVSNSNSNSNSNIKTKSKHNKKHSNNNNNNNNNINSSGNRIDNTNSSSSNGLRKYSISYDGESTSKSNSTLSLYSNISNLHSHSIQTDASIVCENCNHHMTKPIQLLSLSMEPTSASSLDIHRNNNFSITLASNSRSSSPATILHQQQNSKHFLINSNANIINTSLNNNKNKRHSHKNSNNSIHEDQEDEQEEQEEEDNSSNNDIPDASWSNYNSNDLSNNNNSSFASFLSMSQQTTTTQQNTSPKVKEITSPTIQSESKAITTSTASTQLQNNNNLASSLSSTSDLFNKSLISSFLNGQGINSNNAANPFENSYKNNMNTSTNSCTNNHNSNNNNGLNSFLSNSNSSFSALKDLSYDAKDMSFSVTTMSNSELNSMIADSINRSSASNSIARSSNTVHTSGGNNSTSSDGYHQHHSSNQHGAIISSSSHNTTSSANNTTSNSTKEITFLVSDNPDSVKEKSNVSNTSSIISASNLNRHLTPNQLARPRGRSISESFFMSPINKESLNDIQRAIESEKIKKTKFEELKSILGEREDIMDINDIHFIQKVGEGAFSEVWEGWWKGIHVAIKKLKIIGDEEQFKERFIREVQNLKKSNHQNIVMFIGACYKPACIITEYMAGGSLYNILHNPNTPKVKYSFPLVLKMATDMALGLLHLHSITIVHRDLTSQNILLDELGNIKITDFGLSREKSREGSMTMTNGGICNPRWRPPELTKNLGHYSEKVDVYCFSLVVWEILTGEIPFAELDGSQASAQVAYAGLRPPVPDYCDPELKSLLTQCWEADPNDRPPFTYIVNKLKEISWNNPIGFVSDSFYQYSEPSTPRLTLSHQSSNSSNISLSPTKL